MAFGLLVAVLIGKLRSRSTSTRIEAGLSLLTPFAAFLAAEVVHGSGILAAVAAGLWVGHHSHGFVDPLVRIEIQAAWRVVGFALNSLLFMLVGLQTRDIIDTVDQPMGRVLLTGAAVTAAVIGHPAAVGADHRARVARHGPQGGRERARGLVAAVPDRAGLERRARLGGAGRRAGHPRFAGRRRAAARPRAGRSCWRCS